MAEERYVTISGNRIRYLEDGRGPHIVLVHGLGSQAERWSAMMPRLAREHRVIAPDLPGFGLSDKPEVDYTPEYFAKFMISFLEELGIRRAALVGSSLGGQVVAETAASCRTGLVSRAVLVSPTGTMRSVNPTLNAYIMAAMYPRHEAIRTAYGMMAGRDGNVDESSIERFREAMSRPNAKMAFLSTVMGFKHWPAITSRLGSITAPVLLVWGSEDTMIPMSFAEGYVEGLRDCRLVVMEGCGHRPHVEEPEKLAGLILDFVVKRVHARQSLA